MSEKELRQVPSSDRVVIATRGIDVSVFHSTSSRCKHGAFVGNPPANFLKARVEFLRRSDWGTEVAEDSAYLHSSRGVTTNSDALDHMNRP